MVRLVVAALVLGVACGPGTGSGPADALTRVVVPAQDKIDAWVPAYSPDGKRIAWYGYDFANRPRVGLVDGGNLVPVTPTKFTVTDFAWMPDSQRLLVADWEEDGTDLVIVDLSGRVLRRIELSKNVFSDTTGMFVLDQGTAIISAMDTPSLSPLDLYRVDLTSGRVWNLTKTTRLSETWPVPIDESRWLITAGYISQDDRGPSGWMGVFEPETGETRQVSETAHFVDQATIAQGSSTAVFDTAFQRDTGLWMMDIDGGEAKPLLDAREVRWPSMSPDGTKVVVKIIAAPGESGAFIEVELPRG